MSRDSTHPNTLAGGDQPAAEAAPTVASAALARFAPATRAWFASTFAAPTPAQEAAWSALQTGASALVIAPTGSGKTLAAFLHALDRLFDERARAPRDGAKKPPAATTRVLYISPLKALGADVRKNLRLPLHGVAAWRKKLGDAEVTLSVGMRTGDTPASERASLTRHPPDILITTPESLYLMLTSRARETLRGVRTVILDEVHAVAGTKRGAHLAVSLERLDGLLASPAQRVGLSATVRPVERVAAFLGGSRAVTVVNPPAERRPDLRIVAPLEDMRDLPVPDARQEGPERLGRVGSMWFHVEAGILDRVLACGSTIVFVNSRGLAERLTARLNELYAERCAGDVPDAREPLQYPSSNGGTGNRAAGLPPLLARAHHGSVSKERRNVIEQDLKSGALRCVVATSSLELGIDMGQVDQVIQVAAPPSVSAGLQRVGRAGHHVGGTPTGLVYPRTRRELVDAAVTVECMLDGRIEAVSPPRNPLDILAQQTVAAAAMEPLVVDDWFATVRRADPFRNLPRSAFEATLDLLAGRFPSHEFAGFRPRLVWDRKRGILTARPGAQRLAVVNGGTIPDRGTFGVVLPEGEEQAGSRRVGELDEEMVYESRVNDVITLGASTWRIRQITHDQVVVTPAPGKSARLPFWHGDGPGRPAELGEAVGAFLRAVEEGVPSGRSEALDRRLRAAGLEPDAVANLLRLLDEQRAQTRALPTDQTLVVESCRDEAGDWRVMLHSPYGRRVHAPWALAVAERIRQRFSADASVVASDDGIVARIPDADRPPPGADLFLFATDGLRQRIAAAVGASALFAARFRECAARALLLPRRSPGRRSPLWQQRLRAGQLLEVARGYPDFPILVETARECLQDVYDLPALEALMRRAEAGALRFVEVVTDTPSVFAANLLFGYVAEFMYEGDAPLAERRASLLSLDAGLLRDLLGQGDLGTLLDPEVVARVAAALQHTAPESRLFGLEGAADLLRELGPLSLREVAERLVPTDPAATEETAVAETRSHLAALAAAGRIIPVRIGAEPRWAAIEDAGRLRDALGTVLPEGLPEAFLEPAADPLGDLAARYARSHTPFTTGQLAARWGIGVAVADAALRRLGEQGRVLRGEFGPELLVNSSGPELLADASEPDAPAGADRSGSANPLAHNQWVWEDVFRRLRARSLQAAREATRPVERSAYVRQLLERQYLLVETSVPEDPPESRAGLRGLDGVTRVVEQLAGLALPASLWERHILPARVHDYTPGMLDELIAAGEVIWSGAGRIGESDGLVALHLRDFAGETLPLLPDDAAEAVSPLQQAILDLLADGGAYFARQIAALAHSRIPADVSGTEATPTELQEALWGLAWSGRITTDTWATLRALTGARGPQPPKRRAPGRSVRGRVSRASFLARTGWSGNPPDSLMLAGRWSVLPRENLPDTVRALAVAEALLDRYGVVTRGAVAAEKVPGGFPAIQRVFRGMEDAGRLLRGRFVDGLGAAQFADNAAINRLRALADRSRASGPPVALAAADPANPYGAAVPWPEHVGATRPTRAVGALVVIRDGRLALWLARGGRSLLAFPEGREDDLGPESWFPEAGALAQALLRGAAAPFILETVNDRPADRSPLAPALRAAGFSREIKGLAWYGRPRS